MTAHYWIAQHIPDVFRNEPRNVGVFVHIGDDLAARFFGEHIPGESIDGRKLRGMVAPDVYRQWVDFWRVEMINASIQSLVENSGVNYRVVEGGVVTDVGGDTAEEVASYLYSLLVSEGGLEEALMEESKVQQRSAALETEIESALRSYQLLATRDDTFVRHPVKRGITVRGQSYQAHKPAFVQENGCLYVMEPIDFTMSQKRRSRDHAGWAAYMFSDIKSADSTAHTIALVRLSDEDMDQDDVVYGLGILGAEAQIVNWLNNLERQRFLDERKEIAESNGC